MEGQTKLSSSSVSDSFEVLKKAATELWSLTMTLDLSGEAQIFDASKNTKARAWSAMIRERQVVLCRNNI